MSALDTFRRAMRGHERRAKRMALGGIAWALRTDRIRLARGMTPICDVRSHTGAGASYRRTRFLYSLAADAVARLRIVLARETAQAAKLAPFNVVPDARRRGMP